MSSERSMVVFESILSVLTESPLTRDPDGDYVIAYAGAKFYARVLGAVSYTHLTLPTIYSV